VSQYLRHVTSRHLEDARQVVIWREAGQAGCLAEAFLADVECPRLVATGSDLDLADCKLLIDAFFVFLENVDQVTQFLARLPRCALRARFVVVFPGRGNQPERDQKGKQAGGGRSNHGYTTCAFCYWGVHHVFPFIRLSFRCNISRTCEGIVVKFNRLLGRFTKHCKQIPISLKSNSNIRSASTPMCAFMRTSRA
jgi:hypothetical protein